MISVRLVTINGTPCTNINFESVPLGTLFGADCQLKQAARPAVKNGGHSYLLHRRLFKKIIVRPLDSEKVQLEFVFKRARSAR